MCLRSYSNVLLMFLAPHLLATICLTRRVHIRSDFSRSGLHSDSRGRADRAYDNALLHSRESAERNHLQRNTRSDEIFAMTLLAANRLGSGLLHRYAKSSRLRRIQSPIAIESNRSFLAGNKGTIETRETPMPTRKQEPEKLSVKSAELQQLAQKEARRPEKPESAVGIDGGDALSGLRNTDADELKDLVDEASTARIARKAIIAQYYTERFWLWRQWSQTVVRRTLRNEVVINSLVALLICFIPHRLLGGWASGVFELWRLAIPMTTFPLAFFLSGSYSFYRSVYFNCREVQEKLNDLLLLTVESAARNETTGLYTRGAEEMLSTVIRYVRVFHMLFYASVTKRFAPLNTPQGIRAIRQAGLLKDEEAERIVGSSLGHDSIMMWFSCLFDTAIVEGRLRPFINAPGQELPATVPYNRKSALQRKIHELRQTYSPLKNKLAGRMPLAYVQLMQILTDGMVIATPFALYHLAKEISFVGVVFGTSLITLLYSSILTLAKLFLDPLNNEVWRRPGAADIVGIEVATLLQETSLACERWVKGTSLLPSTVLLRSRNNTSQQNLGIIRSTNISQSRTTYGS